VSAKGYPYVSQNYSEDVVGKKLTEAINKWVKKRSEQVNVRGI
jgi:hypothetical protein